MEEKEKVKTIKKITNSIKKITDSLNLLPNKEEIDIFEIFPSLNKEKIFPNKCLKSTVYVQFINHIYTYLSNQLFIPPILLSIYYMNNLTPKVHCAGIIKIVSSANDILISTRNKNFMIEKNFFGYKSYTTEFKLFAEELKSRINKSSCKMTTFIYGVDDHRYSRAHTNVIFAFKNQNMIELVIYDPHGSNPKGSNPKFYDLSNYLVESLQNVDPTFLNKGRHMISCPKGLQTYGKDKTGLCTLYSLFFVSCVLQVSQELDIISNLDQLYLIEECIIKSLRPKELEEVVVKFSLQLLTFHDRKCREKIKLFDELFYNSVVKRFDTIKEQLIECNKKKKHVQSDASIDADFLKTLLSSEM